MWLLKSCILQKLLYFKQDLIINSISTGSHNANVIHG